MALINCPECGKEMSDSVKKCPHCGYKIKSSKGMNKVLLAVIIVGVCLAALVTVLIIVISNSVKKASKLKEQKPTTEVTNNVTPSVQGDFDAEEATVDLSPNIGKTFTATTKDQNIDGAYNISLRNELPIVLVQDADNENSRHECSINNVEFYTSVTHPKYNPSYELYLSIEFSLTKPKDERYSSQVNGYIIFYDLDGRIVRRDPVVFKTEHNGKVVEHAYDTSLPLGTYEIEFLAD